MVLSEFVESAVLGGSGVWSYNRENFMYDRHMRQEQEFKIQDNRCKQVDLWREDIRDMIEMTEKKMDRYTVVSALELGFCVTLLTEGRLPPGTPEWLLWFFMMADASGVLFLLMAVWFAMHASVVAQSNSVRLLTQLVRMPIPSWQQMEATRSYGAAFEGVPMSRAMRVPFVQTTAEGFKAKVRPFEKTAVDPWGMERWGGDIYELQPRPIISSRHIRLVREAVRQWQAYDAFARVAMTLGTIMVCEAVSYYVIGYVLVQDGSPWAAWVCVTVFQSIALKLLRLDISMSCLERSATNGFLVGGAVICSVAAADWATYRDSIQQAASAILPLAFAAHAGFLLVFLHCCHVKRHPEGSMFPTRFRTVLNMDIFGWLVLPPEEPAKPAKAPEEGRKKANEGKLKNMDTISRSEAYAHVMGSGKAPRKAETSSGWFFGREGEVEPSALEQGSLREVAGNSDYPEPSGAPLSYDPSGWAKSPPKKQAGAGRAAAYFAAAGQTTPKQIHRAVPVASRPQDTETAGMDAADRLGAGKARQEAALQILQDLGMYDEYHAPLQGVGPPGMVPEAIEGAFAPPTFGPESLAAADINSPVQPGKVPWLVFRSGIWFCATLWFFGAAWSLSQFLGFPDIPAQVMPTTISVSQEKVPQPHRMWMNKARREQLKGGIHIPINWPTHHFQPIGMSCDMAERLCAFSDGFQLYSAFLSPDLVVTSTHLAPPCEPLEGEAIEDVAVACTVDSDKELACGAFVLHDRGRWLAQCALVSEQEQAPEAESSNATGNGSNASVPDGGKSDIDSIGQVEENMWRLAGGWLQRKEGSTIQPERITSVAVDDAPQAGQLLLHPVEKKSGKKTAELVVGTSYGRAVRLRQSLNKTVPELVPSGNVWKQIQQPTSSALQTFSPLQILAGGYLFILDGESSSVHVINTTSARALAELELPKKSKCNWIALTGGQSHLFALSTDISDGDMHLWSFPLVEVLSHLTELIQQH